MGFFKTLFSGKEESEEEKDAKRQENNFDVLKFDGIQALRIGRADYAIACLTHALDIKADAEAQTYLVTFISWNATTRWMISANKPSTSTLTWQGHTIIWLANS